MDGINNIFLYDSVSRDSAGNYILESKENKSFLRKLRDIFINRMLIAYPLVALLIILFWGLLQLDWTTFLIAFLPSLFIIVSYVQISTYINEHKNVIVPKDAISNVTCMNGKCIITYKNGSSKQIAKRVLEYTNDEFSASTIRDYFEVQGDNLVDTGDFFRINVILGIISSVLGIAVLISSFFIPSLYKVRLVSSVIVAISLFITLYFGAMKKRKQK